MHRIAPLLLQPLLESIRYCLSVCVRTMKLTKRYLARGPRPSAVAGNNLFVVVVAAAALPVGVQCACKPRFQRRKRLGHDKRGKIDDNKNNVDSACLCLLIYSFLFPSFGTCVVVVSSSLIINVSSVGVMAFVVFFDVDKTRQSVSFFSFLSVSFIVIYLNGFSSPAVCCPRRWFLSQRWIMFLLCSCLNERRNIFWTYTEDVAVALIMRSARWVVRERVSTHRPTDLMFHS